MDGNGVAMRFSDGVVDELVKKIKREGWDENLSKFYTWPLREQLAILQKICDKEWIRDLMSMRHDSEGREPTFEMTLKLREHMPQMIADNNKASEIKKWIVKDWGGIKSGGDERLLECIGTAEEEHKIYKEKGNKAFTFERVASWSKYMAFKFPQQYAVYDARVIYSLNWLLSQAYQSQVENRQAASFFPFLYGQNSIMGLLDYELYLLLKYGATDAKVLREHLDEDIKGRRRNPKRHSLFTSKIKSASKIYIQEKQAYSEYCDLLQRLAKRLYPDDEKHRMTKVEMMLFSIADAEIAKEVLGCFIGINMQSAMHG